MMSHHTNAAQMNHAMGYARQTCARIFRDGGSPTDALAAFGLRGRARAEKDWSRAVEDIAQSLCRAHR